MGATDSRNMGAERSQRGSRRSPDKFPSTIWKRIQKAKEVKSGQSREGLAELCEAYWHKLGTATLHGGTATLTIKPRMVLNMPLKIIYNGNMHFQTSTVTPAELTQAGLRSSSMSMGSGMTGMKM